jgi:HlyD family secretion protein
MIRALRVVAILIAIGALAGCGEDADPGHIELSGRIEAPTVDLAPRVAGRVVEVLVREGDRVQAGDVLVTLDLGEAGLAVAREAQAVASAEARLRDLQVGTRASEIEAARARVADREAAVAQARSDVERRRGLLARGVVSEEEHELAETALERAEAALAAARDELAVLEQGAREWRKREAAVEVERARVVLEQAREVASEAEIRAPADAVVLHRMAEPGLLLQPGQPALTLAFADRLYVRTFVPETALGRVRVGDRATVTVDAFPGRSFPARVAEISPAAEFTPKPVDTRGERVNLVYAAEVDLDAGWDAPLVPGQPADVLVDDGATGDGAEATPR